MNHLADLATQVGHIMILGGVVAAYLRANQAKNLVEIQKDTIDALQKGFDVCKQRLSEVERIIETKDPNG